MNAFERQEFRLKLFLVALLAIALILMWENDMSAWFSSVEYL
jgi:hypothetical protein